MEPELMVADCHNLSHGSDMAQLLSRYAEDPMGGGKALEADIADNLARELGKLPHAFTVLCYVN